MTTDESAGEASSGTCALLQQREQVGQRLDALGEDEHRHRQRG